MSLQEIMQTKKIKAGDYEFDCRILGNPENEMIMLLHGFPETSYMWIGLMEKLASIGFYCIAPNLRGYSEHACPKGVKHYQVQKLAADVLTISEVFHKSKFHLIGHDWGAGIGWNLAYEYPERIISWTAISLPHPRGFSKAIKTDKEQRKKSRYIGWFLLPIVPEIMLRKNNFEKFRRLWKNSSPEEQNDYLSVFKRKQTLTAALNYYRANLGRGKKQFIGDIAEPTLFIWGKKDLAIGRAAAENNHTYMKGAYTFLELEGGHWLIQTNYKEVEAAIIDHVTKNKMSTLTE